MRIGELAERTGVSARMLRYCEQQGLLAPTRGSGQQGAGHRRPSASPCCGRCSTPACRAARSPGCCRAWTPRACGPPRTPSRRWHVSGTGCARRWGPSGPPSTPGTPHGREQRAPGGPRRRAPGRVRRPVTWDTVTAARLGHGPDAGRAVRRVGGHRAGRRDHRARRRRPAGTAARWPVAGRRIGGAWGWPSPSWPAPVGPR